MIARMSTIDSSDSGSGRSGKRFSYSPDALRTIASDVIAYAASRGATACDTEVSEGFGQNVTVRRGEVETIEYTRDKGLGVSVYLGQRRGHSSTSDLSREALRLAVDAALSIARFTAEDDCAGLPDAARLATSVPDLDLSHPWVIAVEEAIELGRACEAAAFAVDPRITNSEGASVSTQESQFVYANSLGFIGGFPTSRHSLSCSVIADDDEIMQRDDWYDSRRDVVDLADAVSIGRIAGQRAVRRLGSRKISTCEAPVLFEAPIASALIGHFVSAVSGGSLYRKASFLCDAIRTRVFSQVVTITERPHIRKGLASSPFDDEGVATLDRDVVDAGMLQGYFLGTYSARKLKLETTGNAGGNHNLIIAPGSDGFDALLRRMGRGLLVTELLGHGVNLVTGDYSRGAAGFWVEGGEIAYPVEEITIAGNLRDIFLGITAIGSDVLVRGSRQCGSILVERMTIAGE